MAISVMRWFAAERPVVSTSTTTDASRSSMHPPGITNYVLLFFCGRGFRFFSNDVSKTGRIGKKIGHPFGNLNFRDNLARGIEHDRTIHHACVNGVRRELRKLVHATANGDGDGAWNEYQFELWRQRLDCYWDTRDVALAHGLNGNMHGDHRSIRNRDKIIERIRERQRTIHIFPRASYGGRLCWKRREGVKNACRAKNEHGARRNGRTANNGIPSHGFDFKARLDRNDLSNGLSELKIERIRLDFQHAEFAWENCGI